MPTPSSTDSSSNPDHVLKTLLFLDLVDSTALVESLGDYRAAQLFAQCDATARELLVKHYGTEIDKTDGFLFIFNRPIDAVMYAIAFHGALVQLSEQSNVRLAARAGIHLGEVVLRRNPPEHVARGAKPMEVEGLAKPMAARVMSLALGAQTLMTRAAFDLARRAAGDWPQSTRDIKWINHGAYCFKGIEETQAVFEVGLEGLSPLSAPPSTEKSWRATEHQDEADLGWRPSAGQSIPSLPDWRLERKLGEGSLGELWLGRAKETDSRAETIGLDASLGQLRKPQERAFLFHRTRAAHETTDRTSSWRLSGCVSCVIITSGDQQGTFVVLTKKPLSGGRESTEDLQINDPRVSRKHFEILQVDARYWIRELQSRNGVFVNGMRISGEQNLLSGDKIRVGDTDLAFYPDY